MRYNFIVNAALAALNLYFYAKGRKWYNLVVGLLCVIVAALLWGKGL